MHVLFQRTTPKKYGHISIKIILYNNLKLMPKKYGNIFSISLADKKDS
jgi:hypothetical protein